MGDVGIGIAGDDLEHIFEPFRHASQQRHQSGGKGLGLYIVRRIVEAHHGTIDAQSTPGRGSTFTVRLSVAVPEQDRTYVDDARPSPT